MHYEEHRPERARHPAPESRASGRRTRPNVFTSFYMGKRFPIYNIGKTCGANTQCVLLCLDARGVFGCEVPKYAVPASSFLYGGLPRARQKHRTPACLREAGAARRDSEVTARRGRVIKIIKRASPSARPLSRRAGALAAAAPGLWFYVCFTWGRALRP